MAESIMQVDKVCYITGRTDNLHKHHIYFGNPGRKQSEQYGCWVWLTGEWHNQSSYAVHFNRAFDLRLKRKCQSVFETLYSHEKFMEVFGRNYLE